MHDLFTIAIDDPIVCQSVCVSCDFTRLRCANTAKRIEMLFEVDSLGHTEHYGPIR